MHTYLFIKIYCVQACGNETIFQSFLFKILLLFLNETVNCRYLFKMLLNIKKNLYKSKLRSSL